MFIQTKAPEDIIQYTVDYSRFLKDDTIVSASCVCDTGLTVAATSNTSKVVTVLVSGGTDGTTYDVEASVTTTAGQTKAYAFQVAVVALPTID